ncbi:MAG: peptide deformylase [Buchnera aphidicola (Periphyllus lyropictus)]|uniref:peptide deformylase n=1 Tax=Buchnera aphidicola TaxID=9 RepID=UPI001EC12A29|nr:peptide deformylase [Buchnera aphidicola]NIH16501.1 peptide deformylase [Buchnera aphidicola (Periphyllus lyropictus)]USS94786.1 peptide deformylase [Buchnera aphidicola (Periphyllus lyropictus)]
MSILKILKYPNIKLRKISKPVKNFNNDLKNIINNMLETMRKNNGIGLAAIQINIKLQIIVIEKIHPLKKVLILINPKIKKKSKKIIKIKEGCLSIPKYEYITNSRSKNILVKAYNKYGEKFFIKAKNMLSVCIQHEIDHLKGKLFIDYLSPLKKDRIDKYIMKKIKKNEKT